MLARRAKQIEDANPADEVTRAEHLALVVGAIMQASASLEAELHEVVRHGPGHFSRSSTADKTSREFLAPVADQIERCPGDVLERWNLVLHLHRRSMLDKSKQPFQDAALLVDLRNEIAHYRSLWDGQTKKRNLGRALAPLKFAAPPWVATAAHDFPYKILGAACASWASRTAAQFLDEVCSNLGFESVLDRHRQPGAPYASVMPRRSGG